MPRYTPFGILCLLALVSLGVTLRLRLSRLDKAVGSYSDRGVISWHGVNSRSVLMAQAGDNSVEASSSNGTSYSRKDVMLNVAKQAPSAGAAYRVQLPKGMEYPTLTPKQQIVADRMRESLKQDSGKSDLDLLKEELKKIIDNLDIIG